MLRFVYEFIKIKGKYECCVQALKGVEKLDQIAKGQQFWTGGFRQPGGSYPWTDQYYFSDGSSFTFTDLSGGNQPSKSFGEHFISVDHGEIKERTAVDKLPYICMYK